MQARAVVSGALRKLGRLGSGREPRAVDAIDTLAALQGLYRSWIVAGAFGRLHDVTPLTDFTASGNQRIFRNHAGVTRITLPATSAGSWVWCCGAVNYETVESDYGELLISDTGETVQDDTFDYREGYSRGCGLRDGSPIVIVDAFAGLTIDFLYDASTRRWQNVNALALDDEAPRSWADPQGLQACLAVEVADMFGADVPAPTILQARRYTQAMTSQWSMPRREVQGVYV